MLIKIKSKEINGTSLSEIIERIEVHEKEVSFGEDIDKASQALSVPHIDEEGCCEVLLNWLGQWQPCLFGRMGAKRGTNVSYDICWISQSDIEQGDQYVSSKIQIARRKWKNRACEGLASGFLIAFQHERLARAKPGLGLLNACRKASELYIVEHAPLEYDTIYTEAIPLRINGNTGLFKAGINIFYKGAHRTLNHDRRVPCGLLISVNSPGHLANSLVMRGVMPSLEDAVRWTYGIAMRSVGNGGIGLKGLSSNSWHSKVDEEKLLSQRCPITHRQQYIPEHYSGETYSATYHTDVLLPKDVTIQGEIDPDYDAHQIWPWLVIDYISERKVPYAHINYGLFHPHLIADEARYHNPWPPRVAQNAPLFKY